MDEAQFKQSLDNVFTTARAKLAARRAERARLVGFRELVALAEPSTEWLWHGFLPRGGITLLTSQWKAGKTTLVSVLLTKLNAGGQLAGCEVRPGRAAVVSEEPSMHWRRRAERLDFGEHRITCRPFSGRPTPDGWRMLVDVVRQSREEEGADLAVIDTFAGLTPSSAESNAAAMLDVLRPLEQLTERGMSVLILHHPSKGGLRAGQAARGTGALSAYADVLLEMRCPARSGPNDRRRRISAWSRFDETPRELVLELSADGRDITSCPDALDEDLERGQEQVCEVLGMSRTQLTRQMIVRRWPEPRRPNAATIWRWLDRAVSLGLVDQAGAGHRGDPFRYWLHGHEVPFEPDLEEFLPPM